MKTIFKVLAFASVLAFAVSCGPKVTGDPEKDAETLKELLDEKPVEAARYLKQCVDEHGLTYFNAETISEIAASYTELAGEYASVFAEEYGELVKGVLEGVSNIDTAELEKAAENLGKNLEKAAGKLEKDLEKAADELEKTLESADLDKTIEEATEKVEDAVNGGLKKLGF